MKKALITGINGQDGSYLAELLLKEGYEVYGIVRRESMESSQKLGNIREIQDRIHILSCQLDSSLSVYKLFEDIHPDECYHLAASSFVSFSLEDDMTVMMNNFVVTHNILIAALEVCPGCRIFFAGSSEIFGNAAESPQTEMTACSPRSVYGISKLSSHCLIKNYRSRYGIYACTGFLYNHESPRRGKAFVTRKITVSVAEIAAGRRSALELGNLDAERDWGYAPDYVRAMHLMMKNAQPKDYIIATGRLHSVRDLLEVAFGEAGLDYRNYVRVNPDFIRPSESVPLCGDASLILKDLGWRAEKPFDEIIREMVRHDMGGLRD